MKSLVDSCLNVHWSSVNVHGSHVASFHGSQTQPASMDVASTSMDVTHIFQKCFLEIASTKSNANPNPKPTR